jgi:hypothetical protein
MRAKLFSAVLFASLVTTSAAIATPHDYVCETIETKYVEADTMIAQCFECAEASAYFVENPFDSETSFETCDYYGGLVDWLLPVDYWEPWEEVPYGIEDCIEMMDRSERLHALYDLNCL